MTGPRVVYIAGYGRSGSTVLDKLLSCHPNIISGGEIFRAAEVFSDSGAMCTCGAFLSSCPVWKDVRPHYVSAAEAFGGLQAMQDAFYQLQGIGSLRRGTPIGAKVTLGLWAELEAHAFAALAASGPTGAWIVDSSKTARGAAARPLLLQTKLGADVRVVGLSRRAGSVMRSAAKGGNRAIEGGTVTGGSGTRAARAYSGWMLANAAVERLRTRMGQDRVMALRYEDFAHDPDSAYTRILNMIGESPDPDWRNRAAPTERHLLGGNRSRFAKLEIRPPEAEPRFDAFDVAGRAMGRAMVAAHVI